MKAFIQFDYPEEMKTIISNLEKRGRIMVSYDKLEDLYMVFSDEEYCAGFMLPSDGVIEHFVSWLAKIDITGCPPSERY